MGRVFSLLISTSLLGAALLLSIPQSEAAQPKTKVREKKRKSDSIQGPVYFYSVTHEESSGWIYVIPFCKKLSVEEFRPIRRSCKAMASKGDRCATNNTVELKEAGTEKTRKFKLDYFVFAAEKDCVRDRESYTSGDVVPFR